MDLNPGSWGGLELGLKIGSVKTSRYLVVNSKYIASERTSLMLLVHR